MYMKVYEFQILNKINFFLESPQEKPQSTG